MIRVILISYVRPFPDIAGQVVLYRHLVDEQEIDLTGIRLKKDSE